MKRSGSNDDGMTLIETLVALAVLAVGLIAALRAGASGADLGRELRLRQYAGDAADNALIRIRLERQRTADGSRRLPCPQAGFAFVCEQTLAATAHPEFREARVAVHLPDDGERLLVQRVALIPVAR